MQREIKLRVRDGSSKKLLGYEYFNTSLSDGYYYLDLSELKDGEDVGECTCKTNYNENPMIRPQHPLSKLIREEYTGIKDKNDTEIYEGDGIKDKYGIFAGFVEYGQYQMKPQSKHDRPTHNIGFFVKTKDEDLSLEDMAWYIDAETYAPRRTNSITVTGNIHESPELLEDKSQK